MIVAGAALTRHWTNDDWQSADHDKSSAAQPEVSCNRMLSVFLEGERLAPHPVLGDDFDLHAVPGVDVALGRRDEAVLDELHLLYAMQTTTLALEAAVRSAGKTNASTTNDD